MFSSLVRNKFPRVMGLRGREEQGTKGQISLAAAYFCEEAIPTMGERCSLRMTCVGTEKP